MKALGKYIDHRALAAIQGFAFDPKGLVEGNQAGAHKSPFHGFSVEFAGHREYIPGDDTKHIDWVVYYKRDRYMIKQYEAETNLTCQIVLDASESMLVGSTGMTKLDYAAYVAVSLAYLITRVRDKVGLGIFDDRVIDYIPPSNSLASTYTLSRVIEELTPRRQTDISKPLMDLASRFGRRQIVVLLSDFLCDISQMRDALGRLRYDNHEVVAIQVLDPQELDFPFDGRLRLVGLEGYPTLKLRPRELRRRYLEKMEQRRRELRELCEKNNVEYVLADTSHSVKELLFAYLTSRLTHISR
ncbi:MAG: DUF58 domain-containing protein [Planctomycetota bacterium]